MTIRTTIVSLFFLFFVSRIVAQQEDGIKKFSLNELLIKAEEQKNVWYQFLDETTMSAGIYFLKSGQTDARETNQLDEIYYVLRGRANITVGDKIMAVGKGSIVYVRAKTEHHFSDISEDLEAVVISSKATPNMADTTAGLYTLQQIESKRKADEVVWNPFHRCRTMVFGLYMMPKLTGGDSTQTHPVDEINIVTRGSGKFSVDAKQMNVEEGDIIYVRKGQGHFFHDLNQDLDVLILFEKKSIQK